MLVDGSGLSTTVTDLGWTIELEQARLALADLRFTTSGEVHMEQRPSAGVRLLSQLSDAWMPSAHAHPGHSQGGEVIGELPGTFVVDFRNDDGRELGVATLIVGEYTALDFRLARAGADQVDESDALFGHTALLVGTATGPDDTVIAFTVVIDSPLDREIVGVPFEASVVEDSTFEIGLRMLSSDPIEDDHLFDGIDFALLDEADGAADGVVLLADPETSGEVGPEISDAHSQAYFQVRREFQTHDLFDAIVGDP